MSDAATKRTKLDHGVIEHAAAERVNRHGLASLSMSELAAALDVKTPSLYAHVTGIDEVKRMLALRGLADMENCLARAALGKNDVRWRCARCSSPIAISRATTPASTRQ